MDAVTFNNLIERRIELIRSVLATKNAEYNNGKDKLSNFKRSAELANEVDVNSLITPAQEAAAFMRKHIVSVFDLINKHANGDRIERSMIDEKIGDAINYLILIEALLLDDSVNPVPLDKVGQIPELEGLDPNIWKNDTSKPAGHYEKRPGV